MTGMGFVHNWSGLMAARWFLGLTEAGLFPGVNYYLSCWYKRSEFGIRAVRLAQNTVILMFPSPF
jgi:MFS family permease